MRSEAHRYDARAVVQAMVSSTPGSDEKLSFHLDEATARQFAPPNILNGQRSSLSVIYSYGAFSAITTPVRTGDTGTQSVEISRAACVPAGKVEALRNPFADLDAARTAPLRIEHAYISPVPGSSTAG